MVLSNEPLNTADLTKKTWEKPIDLLRAKLKNGKLIAKMLVMNGVHDECDHERLGQELYHLSLAEKTVRIAPASLLLPSINQELYRSFGFLIDVDKCNILLVSDKDMESALVDKDGSTLIWHHEKKVYGPAPFITGNKKIFNIGTNNAFAVHTVIDKKYSTTVELKEALLKRAKEQDGKRLSHNEIICNYHSSSIIGIVCALNNSFFLSSRPDFSATTAKEPCQLLKELIKNQLGLDLTAYIFDCKTGELGFLEA